MSEETEESFDQMWSTLKDGRQFECNKNVLNYFENRLLPTFKAHSSIWILKGAGIENPELGVTNNPSESMNAVLHALQNWKQVPLDIICLSLFYLSHFYHREIQRGIHQLGNWSLHEEFFFTQRDLSLMPFMPKVIDPKEIVHRIRSGCAFPVQQEHDNEVFTESNEEHPSNKYTSQVALARDAVEKRFVTLSDIGCWLVRGSDGTTPYAVRLHPKDSCSCHESRGCYHILACKLMSGKELKDILPVSTNPNNIMTNLQQQMRRKTKEKPAGRKAPRKRDFKDVEEGS